MTQKIKKMSLMALIVLLLVTLCAFLYTSFSGQKAHAIANGDTGFSIPASTGDEPSFVKYTIAQDTTNVNNFQYLMFSKNASLSQAVDLTGVEYIGFKYQAIAGAPSFIFFMDSQNAVRAGTHQGAPDGAKYYYVNSSGTVIESVVSYGHLGSIGGEEGFNGLVLVPMSLLVQASGFDITHVARIGFITSPEYNWGEIAVGSFYAYKGDPTQVQPEIIYNVEDQTAFAYALHADIEQKHTATYVNNNTIGGEGINSGDWYNETSKVSYNSDQTINLIGQSYLDRNLFNSSYYQATGKIDIEIKFSIVSKPGTEGVDNMFGLLLRNKPITSVNDFADIGVPGSTFKGGLFATFPCTPHYIGLNHMGVIVTDYGYPYAEQYPVDYNGVQTVRFEITDSSFNIYLNDLLVGICRDERTGLAATVDSMKDANGDVQAYLGITNTGGEYNLKIYSVISSAGAEMQDYGANNEWHGDKDAVTVTGKNIELSNGKVYTNDYVDISEGIQCDFEITSIPGCDVQNSGMSIYIKNDSSTSNNGIGFKYNLKAMSETGNYRTQLTIGFIYNGNYHSIMAGLYPVDAVGEHYVALVIIDNVWKCVFDGYVADIEDLDASAKTAFDNLSKNKMKVVFETDNYDAFLEQSVGNFTAKIAYPYKPTSINIPTQPEQGNQGNEGGETSPENSDSSEKDQTKESGCGSKIDTCSTLMILIVPLLFVAIKKIKSSIKSE